MLEAKSPTQLEVFMGVLLYINIRREDTLLMAKIGKGPKENFPLELGRNRGTCRGRRYPAIPPRLFVPSSGIPTRNVQLAGHQKNPSRVDEARKKAPQEL